MKLRRAGGVHGRPPSGFPRWAWWTLFLATFTFAVPVTSPWWSTVLRGEVAASDEDGEGPSEGSEEGGEHAAPVVSGSTLRMVLHTLVADGSGLVPIEREVPYIRGVIPQIQAVISELAVAPPGAPSLLPEGTRVLDVAFTKGGTLYVDFSPELDAARALGPDEEKIMVQGIILTVTANFAAVRRLIILVDGKVPRLFHLDLTHALRANDVVFTRDDGPEGPGGPASSSGERGGPGAGEPDPPAPTPSPKSLDLPLPGR